MSAYACGRNTAKDSLTVFGQQRWCSGIRAAPLCDAYQRLCIGSLVRTAFPDYRPYVSVVNWDLSGAHEE